MSDVELMVWALASYGVTFLLCSAEVTALPRRLVTRLWFFEKLLSCYFCTGFWISWGLAYWVLQTFMWSLLHGFAGATFCYVLDAAVRRLESGGTVDEFIERVESD
jgi:hypothetical protein